MEKDHKNNILVFACSGSENLNLHRNSQNHQTEALRKTI